VSSRPDCIWLATVLPSAALADSAGAMAEASAQEVLVSIAAYTACSSVMLVANKAAVKYVPVPGLVACVQVVGTSLYVYAGKALNCLQCDDLDMRRARTFAPYVISFILSVYTNMKALEASNVETVIVFRALSPLCVSFLDWFYLGREVPDAKSMLALLGLIIGAYGYVLSDSEFALDGIGAYSWAMSYLVSIVFSMTEGKRLMQKVKFDAPVWGSVLYTNVLTLPGMLALAFMSGEFGKLPEVIDGMTLQGHFWLVVSIVVGTGISWAGWNCREKVSATAYTLVGVACKFFTVGLNVLVMDKHASSAGIFWLLFCISISLMYRQAPMRKEKDVKVPNTKAVNSSMDEELGDVTVTK